MTSFYHVGNADVSSCEVRIGEKAIVVSYKEVERMKAVIYEGTENGHGHYELSRNDDVGGRATLHRFMDGKFLEGFWKEKDEGMWRIELIE